MANKKKVSKRFEHYDEIMSKQPEPVFFSSRKHTGKKSKKKKSKPPEIIPGCGF
jgi:hypothetical protein